MLTKALLTEYYFKKHFSIAEISRVLSVSSGRIVYWMDKFGIQRRKRSEANYLKHNPYGDPFKIKIMTNESEQFLFGLGLGLFWGEGMKLSRSGVRLGNTDPYMILYFRDFLTEFCNVSKDKIKYSLQVFGDIEEKRAVQFWCGALNIEPQQLGKISMIQLRGEGTYKKKNEFGVLQIACHNTKLKLIIDSFLRTLKTQYPAHVAQLVEHFHGETHFSPAHTSGN